MKYRLSPKILSAIGRNMRRERKKQNKNQKIKLITITPYKRFLLSKYNVNSYESVHNNDRYSGIGMIYEISNKNISILYASDTYKLNKKTLSKLKNKYFSAIFLDECYGYEKSEKKNHHSIQNFITTRKKLLDINAIDIKSRVFTIHLSHKNPLHNDLSKIMTKYDVEVPWDAMTINL